MIQFSYGSLLVGRLAPDQAHVCPPSVGHKRKCPVAEAVRCAVAGQKLSDNVVAFNVIEDNCTKGTELVVRFVR